MSRFDAIIFDLDGTLIDSAPGILKGFELAFKSLNQPIRGSLSPDIIGPPMRETLERLLGYHDPIVLDQLINAFKLKYDSVGYRDSTVYPGIQALLEALHARGIDLYLATNKRHVPTQKIVDELGWRPFFKDALSFDSLQPARSKAAVIGHLIATHGLQKTRTCYVGDRHEDGLASDANSIAFMWAVWGYGTEPAHKAPPHWRRLMTPDIEQLLAL
jgi:phosphoglycolate phosphatase